MARARARAQYNARGRARSPLWDAAQGGSRKGQPKSAACLRVKQTGWVGRIFEWGVEHVSGFCCLVTSGLQGQKRLGNYKPNPEERMEGLNADYLLIQGFHG